MQAKILTPIIFFLLLCPPAMACTIFCFTHNGNTYFCNNEDWKDPITEIRFHPATDGNLAWVYLGFANNWAQGGVNEKGLCFDWVAGGGPYGWKSDPDKLSFKGNLSEQMLRKCANVEQAIAFYNEYNEKHFDGGRTFIADKNGNSVIVGWENGRLFVERGKHKLHSCGYGQKAVESRLKGLSEDFQIGELVNALSDASQVGKYPSQYSNIISLSESRILLFKNRNYDEYISIDYSRKLSEDFSKHKIADLFKPDANVSHVKKSKSSFGLLEHDELIKKVETGLSSGANFKGEKRWTLEERMRHYRVPGVCIAVVRDKKLLWAKAYGVKDRRTNEPVTTNTLFQCGSLSKSVSAVAAMRLAEQGVFDLDKDVNKYLKTWKLPRNELTDAESVTLTHLLGHTGGLNVRSFGGYKNSQSIPNLAQLLDGTNPATSSPVRVDVLPGSTYQYSSGAYCVLQQMIVDARTQPFFEIMNDEVLKPLGMNHCTFQQPIPTERREEIACGHLADGQPLPGQHYVYPEMAAAGFFANVTELAKFYIEIQRAANGESDRLLSKASANQMLRTTIGNYYGLGFVINDNADEVYFGHDGWTEGFCSEAVFHKDRGDGIVVLTNGNHPWFIREIINSVSDAYQWKNYSLPEYEKLPFTDESVTNFVGRYDHAGRLVRISHEQGQLFIELKNAPPAELFRVGDDQFAWRGNNRVVRFTTDPKTQNTQIEFLKPWEKVPSQGNVATKMQDNQKIPDELLLAGEYEKALEGYKAMKTTDPDLLAAREKRINSIGYDFLNSGKVEQSINVLRIGTILHPDSFNAFDSLGEAHLKNGDRAEGTLNYQRSLELNSENENATIAIKRFESQDESQNRFLRNFPKQEYLDDLDQLALRLTATHPHPFLFTPKSEFWDLVDQQKNSIGDSITLGQFIWKCSEIVASVGCSHTSLGWFNQESKALPIGLRFPLEAKLIDGRLYVSDPLVNQSQVEAGSEIFSINGKSVAEIKSDVFKHISSQGKSASYKRQLFNSYATSFVAYSLEFPTSYEIIVKGNNQPIALAKLSEYKPKPVIGASSQCQENLCLDVTDESDFAVLTIRTFAYYGKTKEEEYKAFIDKSFLELRNKRISNLIIDLRMNGGGSTFASTYLLRHLVDKAFTYYGDGSANNSEFDYKQPLEPLQQRFNGEVFVIIDGNGASATGHFCSFIKARKLGTLVGEELGSNQFCTGAQKTFILSNTGITYSVARNTWFTSVSGFQTAVGILPDHNVTQSIEDYISGSDSVFEYIVSLIESSSSNQSP